MATVTVRYIVNDVDASIDFYCRHLGFHEQMHPAPTFAMLLRGDLRLVLSAPSGRGGRRAIDARWHATQSGWVESVLPRGLRPRGDREVVALGGGSLPQRDRHRRGRAADHRRGPVRKSRRTVRAHATGAPCQAWFVRPLGFRPALNGPATSRPLGTARTWQPGSGQFIGREPAILRGAVQVNLRGSRGGRARARRRTRDPPDDSTQRSSGRKATRGSSCTNRRLASSVPS
jgi:catechol 2,3-dioxygenase-like lactoylglutathione lyase family enzyme